MKVLKQKRLQSNFLRAVLVLTSGTVIAQAIGYIIMPLLTRLFSPEEFGVLGLYMRIAGFLAAIGTLRFELSLPLPKSEQHAFQLFRLSVRLSFYILLSSLFIGLVYWFYQQLSITWMFFGLLTLVGAFFLILKNIGTNWAIRTQQFKQISVATVSGSLVANVLKLLAGWWKFGGIGLVVSAVIGAIVAALVFIREYWRLKSVPENKRSYSKMKVLSKVYNEFPRVNLPHMFSDQLRELLIAFIIIEMLDTLVFGSFDHAFRMLKVPLALVGTSIAQVFYQQCSDLVKANRSIYPLVKKTTLSLAVISIIPFGVLTIYGTAIFVFVFGAEWELAGGMAQALSPWLFFNFIASPLSTVPIVIHKQKAFFIFSLVGNVVQVVGLGLLLLYFKNDVLLALTLISGVMSMYFILLIAWKFKLSKGYSSSKAG